MANPETLGFSHPGRDRSSCRLRGNELVVAIQEQRLSRVKRGLLFDESHHDPALSTTNITTAAAWADPRVEGNHKRAIDRVNRSPRQRRRYDRERVPLP